MKSSSVPADLCYQFTIFICYSQSIFKVPGSLPQNMIVKLRMRLAQQRRNQARH